MRKKSSLVLLPKRTSTEREPGEEAEKIMNSNKSDINRLLAAFNHETVDRTPNFEIVIDSVNASHLLGRKVKGLWEMSPEDAIELAQKVGQDAIPCVVKSMQVEEGSVSTHDDLKKLKIEDFPPSVEKLAKYVELARGTGVGICPVLAGPLTAAYMAAGPIPIQSFMMMIYDDPALIAKILDFFTEYSIKLIEAIKDQDFDFYYIGDDVTGFFSQEHLEEMWVPREEKIIKAAQAATPGKPILCHCCGAQAPVLPYFAKWGVNAVHPLQPDLNDIYQVSKDYPDICLVGNVDVSNLLTFGTEEEVIKDTEEHLKRLAKRSGGYVVCSSHSIIDSVKPENYAAMLDTTHNCIG